jgi:hypothetical protein
MGGAKRYPSSPMIKVMGFASPYPTRYRPKVIRSIVVVPAAENSLSVCTSSRASTQKLPKLVVRWRAISRMKGRDTGPEKRIRFAKARLRNRRSRTSAYPLRVVGCDCPGLEAKACV